MAANVKRTYNTKDLITGIDSKVVVSGSSEANFLKAYIKIKGEDKYKVAQLNFSGAFIYDYRSMNIVFLFDSVGG